MLNLYTLAVAPVGGKINTYEGYGVKAIAINAEQNGYEVSGMVLRSSQMWYNFEFPILGYSLPCVFTIDAAPKTQGLVSLAVFEYGGIPDVDYFDIIDLDKDGMPIYETNFVRYKKPLAEDGKSFKERVILSVSAPKTAKTTRARKEK